MKDSIKIIITITLCLSFFAWGTIIVERSVKDNTPKVEDSKIDKYKSCLNASGSNSKDCKDIAEDV